MFFTDVAYDIVHFFHASLVLYDIVREVPMSMVISPKTYDIALRHRRQYRSMRYSIRYALNLRYSKTCLPGVAGAMGRTGHAPPAARWSVLSRNRWDSFSQVESLALLHRARNCFRCAALMEMSVSALYLTFDFPCMGAIKLHARASINVRARESKRRSNAIK